MKSGLRPTAATGLATASSASKSMSAPVRSSSRYYGVGGVLSGYRRVPFGSSHGYASHPAPPGGAEGRRVWSARTEEKASLPPRLFLLPLRRPTPTPNKKEK
eukprot:scaffold2735_cov114-Isochrysis_galbana.AAC.10